MATIGAVGGSQIDANSLARQLVAVERAPLDARISRETNRTTTQISALGSLKSALSTFQSALSSLKSIEAFNVRKAASGDADVFTASATSAAVPGTYGIEVVQLATAQQLASSAFAGGAAQVVGTGTLTIGLGADSFDVAIDATNSTVEGIRNAINAAPDNSGVRATIVNSTTGARLVLTSSLTGATNSIEVTQSGGDGNLAQLTYGVGNTANYTQIATARDAIVNVATFEHRSSTNSVDGAIDGITLDLAAEQPGTTVNLTVSYDTSTATLRIKDFVAAYNKLESHIVGLRGYDATTRTAGAMLGDSLLTGVESDLRRALTDPVSGGIPGLDTLAGVGITTQANGTLKVDEAKLQKALTDNFDAVSSLFGSENGVAAKLDARVEDRLATGSAIDVRTQGLVDKQRNLSIEQTKVDTRMQMRLEQYIKQFTALDTLLSQLSTTSAYLTQQLSNLPKPGGSD